MLKIIIKFFLTILIILFLIIIYFTFIGVETVKFNNLIKSKSNEINKFVKLEFDTTKIYIKPKELNLAVELQNPKILIKENEIVLSNLDLYLSLKSFLTSDFILKRAEISFKQNDIKDLSKISNLFLPMIINQKINKIFKKGKLEGKFIIPFNASGSIGKDYAFSGKISNALINLTKELSIRNLTTEIKHIKNFNNNEFKIKVNDGSIYNLKLTDTVINLKKSKRKTIITSNLRTNGNISLSEVKKISSLIGANINFLKDINGKIDLNTNINFNLNKFFQPKNITYSSGGNISHLEIILGQNKTISTYLPDYTSKVIFKDTAIKLFNSKLNSILEINGFFKTKNKFEDFKIKRIYNFKNKNSNLNGIVNLASNNIFIPNLNYKKFNGIKSKISFDINFINNKNYNIKSLEYIEGNTRISLEKIKLNKNYEIDDFKKVEITTFNKDIKNNGFIINNDKKIIITGHIFDASPLLKSLYKKNEKKMLSKKFSREVKVNLDKTITGTDDDILSFSMIASIKKGAYDKLILKGNFSDDEIVEISIYMQNNGDKTLQVVSDRARPFVKSFDFIEGFEGGKLEYESVITEKISNSNLLISNFKVSKVPALAKLLTLASFQGIADTLSGEGIRFESFEMKTNAVGNVLNIEDALAIGPAVSILLDGYVEKGKLVSLRGTLVPATKLNAIIASIPIVGNILVGKKTGDGVVGVSFKMKGPPKNIKTSVNPIKTLTPRFIVRAVEKLKKNKNKETK